MGRKPKGKVITYTDFGKVQGGMRTSYAYHTDQEAYDIYMGARYLQDMMFYEQGKVDIVFQPEDLRDNNRKYAGLLACNDGTDDLTYYEVGSSTLGAIEALEYLNKKYKELDIKNIKFFGVDNSKWMNYVAMNCHSNYVVEVYEDVKDATHVECDLFFAKGISLMYAYMDEESMCNMLKKTRLAIFDYTFSMGELILDHVDTGLKVAHLSFDKCKKLLEEDRSKVMILRPYVIKKYNRGINRITYDCIYGERELVDKYIEYLENRTGENLDNYGDPKFIRQEEYEYY